MTAWLRGWWDRLLRRPRSVQPLVSCTHPAWGPCQWRVKGSTPGWKAAGYYCRCLNCGVYVPC